jgi:cell division protein FtsB
MKYSNRHVTRIRKIGKSPVTIGVLMIVCFVFAKASWNIHDKAQLTHMRLKQAHTELLKLENRQKTLSHKVEIFSTDEGVEAEMRTKYRAVKEGEYVAMIVEPKDHTSAVVQATTTTSRGWFKGLLHVFGIGK